MSKRTITTYFSKMNECVRREILDESSDFKDDEPNCKIPRLEISNDDAMSVERDPGLRKMIWDYPSEKREDVIRAYISLGPYQLVMENYPYSDSGKQRRRFQSSWFKNYSWLEYSPSKDAAFCFSCYLFCGKASSKHGTNAFVIDGFRNWKKVSDGRNCSFNNHVGGKGSTHNMAEERLRNLVNKSQHIENVFQKQDDMLIRENRLRLKTTIDVVRWLTFQACAFRGNDERPGSSNRGNCNELIKLLASYSEEVDNVVLENAPKNAKYTSPDVQKEILHIIANKVRNAIVEEIGDATFYVIIDEARDESKREQMAIVLRFVDRNGILRERFFDLIHVPDTKAATLKDRLFETLLLNNLDYRRIRGQGYDGASNMRGEWNGLQALVMKDSKYAYYIHCMAHRLQLALVAASKEVIPIHKFFSKLNIVVNIVNASSKRHDELQAAQAEDVIYLLSIDEVQSGTGFNQIGTLQRPCETRWSSHYRSIRSFINMYSAVCKVLLTIINEGDNYLQRGEADEAYESITSFEFILIMHIMEYIMGITEDLCQVLQRKNIDILNALQLVSSTREHLQKAREDGWCSLFEKVTLFCQKRNIDITDMNSHYSQSRTRSRDQIHQVTLLHHFRVDIFTAAIDCQLLELNSWFNEDATTLLTLSAALDPRDEYKLFNSMDICKLAKNFYPTDFTDHELILLEKQLLHYKSDVTTHHVLKSISNLVDLCQKLVETRKSEIYYLVDRLIRLVLALPISTATTERAFSAMKIIKSRLRNKMEDDFLRSSILTYIEKDIAEKFSIESIIDDFDLKSRRVRFK